MNDGLVLKTLYPAKSQCPEDLANRNFSERLFVRQVTIPDRRSKQAARIRNVTDTQTSRRKHTFDLRQQIEGLLPRKVLQYVEQRHYIDALLVAGSKEILGVCLFNSGDSQPVRQFNLLAGTICSAQIPVAFPAEKVQERAVPTTDVHNARFAILGEMFPDHRLKVGSPATEKFLSRTADILDLPARYIGSIQNCLPGIQFPVLCSIFFVMFENYNCLPEDHHRFSIWQPTIRSMEPIGHVAVARPRCYHEHTAMLAPSLG